jgi:hypothetical protein
MRRFFYLVSVAALVISLPAISVANTNSPPCAPGQVSTAERPCLPPTPESPRSFQYSLNADPDVIDHARTHLLVKEPATGTHAMIYWDQNQINFRSLVSLESGIGENRPRKTCSTVVDPECAMTVEGYDTIFYNAVVGNCLTTPEAMCVKEFLLIDETGKTIATGTPTKRIHQNSTGWKSTFNAKTNTGFPGSDEPWIWTLDGVEYIHLGILESMYRKQNAIWVPNVDKNLRFSFYPIKTKVDPNVKDGSTEMGCIATDEGVCYQRVRFKENLRFKVTIRVPNNITGWLNGRLDKPIAYTTAYNDNYTDLTIEASPLQEIISAQWVPYTAEIENYLKVVGRYNNLVPGAKNYDVPPVDPDSARALGDYLNFERKGLIKDVATIVEQSWRIQTTTSDANRFASNCSKSNKIEGIVTSNAAVYEPGSPAFDSNEGALTYKVAAPHLKPDGKTENIGRYAFTMREDLIKCVYGLDKLPAYARVEITYGNDDTVKVSTVVLGSRNQWVHLASDNFSYSAPTLKVKLDGWNKSRTLPAVGKSPSKKITITCVKGKTSKKVTAVQPKCPAGFKIKKV